MNDQMVTGHWFSALNIVAEVTLECLAAVPGISISYKRAGLIALRGKPDMIISDNRTELISNAGQQYCRDAKVDERESIVVEWSAKYAVEPEKYAMFGRIRNIQNIGDGG